MSDEGGSNVHQHTPASPWLGRRAHSPGQLSTATDAEDTSGIRNVVEAVGRCITFEETELPEAFFPAHLSVAIIESVFRFDSERKEQSSQVGQRYCRHFGLERRRRNMFELPLVDEQETVSDLLGHYDERGVEGMSNEVFGISCHDPETATCGAETVLNIGKALRHIGVDVLQDVQHQSAHEFERALCSVPGTGRHLARLLLTTSGDDDFVVTDDYVQQFVAEATGDRTVSASWAAHAVCQAAYEFVLSPRHLDYRIYCYLAGR